MFRSILYESYKDHPIDQLYRAGVSLNVNTDAPTIVGIDLNKEYKKLQEHFGWTNADFYTCNVHALKASFIPEELKVALLEKLATGYRLINGMSQRTSDGQVSHIIPKP